MLTFMLSGTRILRAFLIIGCGFSSSSLNECLLGSKFCWLEALDIAMSEESMSKIPMPSGPLSVGVSRGGQEDEDEEEGDSQESFILVWLPGITKKNHVFDLYAFEWRTFIIMREAGGCRFLWQDQNGCSSLWQWPPDGSRELLS